ncbi:3680_t:CDS:2 [Paraglomus occultum]|uniref:3680_t:CDS:1 n=1 Tax=Paraglomus occultum TaxID=144539 RepID=A0A9N9BUM7_9GLOM|nr:3680_t:CDS:2 [Paraglomus occultum]
MALHTGHDRRSIEAITSHIRNSQANPGRADVNVRRTIRFRRSQYADKEECAKLVDPLNNRGKFEYRLKILEQPKCARRCGFGEKDRRIVAPIPILQLIVIDKVHNCLADVREHFTNGMIVKCDIFKQDHTEANLVNYSYAGQEHQGFTLVGNTTASGHLIQDFEDAERMTVYFVFADLSVRTEGSLFTELFEVSTAKNFPGVPKRSSLCQYLKRKGIKMYTRNDSGPDTSDNESSNQSVGIVQESEHTTNAQLDPPIHLARTPFPSAESYNYLESSVTAISQLLESQAPPSTTTQELV